MKQRREDKLSSSETLDAWMSLLVPGYVDFMKKRREDKLSLGLTLAVSSAITAAILSA